jgi:hypothetical protein
MSMRATELGPKVDVARQALTAAWTAAALLAVATRAPEAIRAPVVIGFLCVAPGLALVRLMGRFGLFEELALAVGISVAFTCLTASTLVYTHRQSVTAVLIVVAAVTVATAVPDAVRSVRRRGLLGSWALDPRRAARPLRNPVGAAGVAALAGLRAVPRVLAAPVVNAMTARPPRPRPALLSVPSIASDAMPDALRVRAAPATSLRTFLLEGRQLPTLSGRRLGLPPRRSLRRLGADELRDRLLWPTLHRVLVTWAAQEVRPEIWLVDDLHRRTRPARGVDARNDDDRGRHPLRGVWLTGVSAEVSVPLAWRVLESTDQNGAQAWRSRLALESIDTLRRLAAEPAVVVSGSAYGSLTTFRRGLDERELPYLLRVDPATALSALMDEHGLVPQREWSAGDARQLIEKYIAMERTPAALLAQHSGDGRASADDAAELVVLGSRNRLIICAPNVARGQPADFWLSNLPRETVAAQFESLARLPGRAHVDRARPDLLIDALQAGGDGRPTLQNDLTIFALAHGFRALDASGAAAEAAR